MSACRVGRRVASMTLRHKPCVEAVCAQTLATKVFHYPFSSFPRGGGLDRRLVVIGWSLGGRCPAGVRLRLEPGGKRRLAWPVAPAAMPLTSAALVTKEKTGGWA